jgi:hypothetical protein
MPAMQAPAVVTLEAANAMVPRLRALMDAQTTRRRDIEERIDKLASLIGRHPGDLKVEPADSADARALKTDITSRLEAYQAAWQELEEMGAVLKDPKAGLIDFYGRVDGKLVWLCWRYGEGAVSHYHHLNEGFSGRKPIENHLRQRHLN